MTTRIRQSNSNLHTVTSTHIKYLSLKARVFAPGKGNKIVLETEFSKTPIRDVVVENLWNVLTVSFNKERRVHEAKAFESLEDHRMVSKFKEKVAVSETDTVELGNDLFQWITKNFAPEGFGASSSATLIALSEMLDECTKQDEEASEKEYKASKDAKPTTIAEYFTSLGFTVILEDKKPEDAAKE